MVSLALAIVGAVLMGVVSNEIFAWLPSVAQRLVKLAAKRFRDPVLAERFQEEWQSAVTEIPGGLTALVHAVTIVACVRSVERSCVAEIGSADLDERFSELQEMARDFTETFSNALAIRGIVLDDIARVTRVSIHDLRALLRGDLSKITIGYQSIFAFMPDLSKMLGSDLPRIKARYVELLRHSGGLPPAAQATGTERLKRIWCGIAGHRAFRQYSHSQVKCAFHWSYLRCSRCGDVSLMRAQPCRGTKVRSKSDIDAPVIERFACKSEDRWTYSSLDSRAQLVLDERVEMTRARVKALSKER